jgi:hypothetical protein
MKTQRWSRVMHYVVDRGNTRNFRSLLVRSCSLPRFDGVCRKFLVACVSYMRIIAILEED